MWQKTDIRTRFRQTKLNPKRVFAFMKRHTGICFAWAVTEAARTWAARGPMVPEPHSEPHWASLAPSRQSSALSVGIWALSPLISASLLLQYDGVILGFMYYLVWFGLEMLQNFSILMVIASSFYAISVYEDFIGTSSFREQGPVYIYLDVPDLGAGEKGLSYFILNT